MGNVGGGAPGSKKGGIVINEAEDSKTILRMSDEWLQKIGHIWDKDKGQGNKGQGNNKW